MGHHVNQTICLKRAPVMKFPSPVLITGASGFVGGHLAQTLAEKNVKTKLLVRQTSRLPFEVGPNMELCYGDVTDEDSLRKAALGVKVIFHLAGALRSDDFSYYKNINVEGTRNVCEAAARVKGLKKMVFVSSLSAAGPSKAGRPIDETMTGNPVSYYGKSKLMAEDIVQSFGKKFPWTILRPGAVYGPREKDIFNYFKMVRQGLVLLPGDDSQEVSFVHVMDLVEVMTRAALSPKTTGQVYFVSDGSGYRWGQIASYIGKALNKSYLTIKVPIGIVKIVAHLSGLWGRVTGKPAILNGNKVKEALVPGWVCSNRKLCRDLSFKPRFDLRRGIADTARFYLQEGWLKPTDKPLSRGKK